MCHASNREREENKIVEKSGISSRLLRSIFSTKFKSVQYWIKCPIRVSRNVPILVPTVSLLDNWQTFRSFPLEQISLPVARSIVVGRTLFELDVTRRSLALDHTQRCRGITAQDLLCRLTRLLGIALTLQQPVPLLSQAQAFTSSRESAATNSASPLLSANVDCFLLDAVIGYQPYARLATTTQFHSH